MGDMNIDQVLMQMRNISIGATNAPTPPEDNGGFASLLKKSIDTVNSNQQIYTKLSHVFEVGEHNVNWSEVSAASQKADLSFQAIAQVTNKLVDAYKEVMNMPL